jgi:hypothetical protein
MSSVSMFPAGRLGKNFIPPEFLPEGKDEYYLRNSQIPWTQDQWRHLRADEVKFLVEHGNTSDDWNEVLVVDPIDLKKIKNTSFHGLVRIGRIPDAILEHHDLQVPIGITNSVIVACDIGHEVAVHNVRYLAHYILGDRTMLLNIDEMHTTNAAKFGNGIIKEGEEENSRIWLELMNESGSRSILPFDGILPADAYLWAKYRDDTSLQRQLVSITQKKFEALRGWYGTTGEQCVIKNSRTIKDLKIGSHGYVNGANKLKNLTINSSEAEPTRIGEGVELVDGIIGCGCHVFFGSKAVRFVLGNNSNLKYGARLFDTFLGDNSTISCCEVLNNLVFPAHEQHHNNSFLIASLLMGQSNIAAGATIGSNHNSRANDNEVQAGRGFWPGLCSSVKHSSRFASFVILSKGDYPAELDIPLPFSLLNNNTAENRLEVMPAYWWLYNMYALARNTWKFQDRDRRKHKAQNIEFEALAPDTTEEIFQARRLLELWAAKAECHQKHITVTGVQEKELIQKGRDLFAGSEQQITTLEILGEDMERSNRKVVILKAYKSYHAYTDMLKYYAIKNLVEYLEANQAETFVTMCGKLQNERQTQWVNFGGQLIPESDVAQLRTDVGSGKLKDWNEIHARYQSLWQGYPLEKQKHAFAMWCAILGTTQPQREHWNNALERVVTLQEFIRDQVYSSRKKDYENRFQKNTYRDAKEMAAAIGTIEDNSFIKLLRTETEKFKQRIEKIKAKN